MALPTASDNIFPKLILDEGGTLGTVAAGERRLGIDANGVLVWKNSAGTTSPLVALNKWDATTAPTANEDSGDGYQPGSRWIDTTNDKEYVCLDATSTAAVWTETTQASGSATFVGARVYHNAAQTFTTAVGAVLNFNSERYDTDAFHDTVTNNSRLTVPTGKGGKYLITAHLSWATDAGDAGDRYIALKLNGTTYLGIQKVRAPTTDQAYLSVATVYDLAQTDYVEVEAYQNRGSNLDTFVLANTSPEFTISKIG